jgi:NAD(P)-dependent dehydrogenase (short-subunit alcohol dehydrogenase family)
LTAEDEFSLTDRVAIVTGGSSGIGAASVRRLAAAGARVVVGYNRGLDRAEKLIGELPGTGHCAMHLPLEDSAQIRRVAAAVADQFGRADILVNSAGFTRMVPHADLEALDDDLIDAVLTANVRGPFATIRAFAPPILRYLLPPGWEWLVGTPGQFVPQLLEQSLRALRLNGLEGHPVYSRSPIVLFGHLIRCAQGLHLADVDV